MAIIIHFNLKGDIIMEKLHIFIENENLYKFIQTSMYFNEARKEREILDLWRKGVNNCDIGKQVGYTEGTIRNRKKDIAEKYNKLLDSMKV